MTAGPGGSATPGGGRERLLGIDAARGVALLGMIAVHLLPSRDTHEHISLTYRLASGRAAAAFAVLAGISLALVNGRPAARQGRARAGPALPVVVRALAIGALGLALGYPGSGVEVILPYYAVCFLLAIPLLRLEPRPLALLAVAAAVAVPVASHLLRAHLGAVHPTNPTFGTLLQNPLGHHPDHQLVVAGGGRTALGHPRGPGGDDRDRARPGRGHAAGRLADPRALLPLVAAGSMTLTLYAGHILAIASPVQPFSPPVLFGLQALAVTGFALAWRWRVGRRGPLEAVVARLTDLAGPARRP